MPRHPSPVPAAPLTCGALLVCLLAACGSRSQLEDSGAPPGAGGTTSVSGSGGAGVGGGGAGGADLPCLTLTQDGATLSGLGTDPWLHELRPALTPLDDGRAALSFGLIPVESPGPVPTHIGHAAFPAWGAWPESLGQGHHAADSGGNTFVAAPGRLGGTALLLSVQGSGGTFYAPSVLPGSDHSPLPDGVAIHSFAPGRPLFLAPGAAAYLAAHEVPVGPFAHLVLTAVAPSGALKSLGESSGCGASQLTAAAVPSGDGHLVAFSSGRPFGACLNDDGIPGPPSEIQIARRTAGDQLLQGATLQGSDPIQSIHLAARSDGGAWLVWQENGNSSFQPPPIVAARLDAEGQLASSVIELVPRGITPGQFAAAALGDQLVLAWVDSLDPSISTLMVQVFRDDGGASSPTGISAEGWIEGGRLALLGAPAADALILAWSSTEDLSSWLLRLRAARFRCAAPG